jgi:hypothetical protein
MGKPTRKWCKENCAAGRFATDQDGKHCMATDEVCLHPLMGGKRGKRSER